MALEEKAIEHILTGEPEWRRTPTHNRGFDLYQGSEQDDCPDEVGLQDSRPG